MKTKKINPAYITKKNLAAALSVSERSISRWLANGLPCLDIAPPEAKRRTLRFRLADCRAWLRNEAKRKSLGIAA